MLISFAKLDFAPWCGDESRAVNFCFSRDIPIGSASLKGGLDLLLLFSQLVLGARSL